MARILGKAAYRLQQQAVQEVPTQVKEVNNDGESHKCPECGFIAKSEFGLLAHKKAHNNKDQSVNTLEGE